MKTITYLIAIAMLVSMIAIPIGSTSDDPISEISTSVSSIPDYTEGYGFDVSTMTMTDHNGFEYSYQPDGIIKLVLPWGYTTYFSFGLTGTYLGTPAIRTALDYTWNWDVDCIEFNHTAYTETYIQPVYDAETNTTTEGYYLNESSIVVDGYDYVFLAENSDSVLDWSIQLEFFHEPGRLMKVTHQVTNNYPNAITDIEFWYLFDLSQTPAPYQIETSLGVVYGPLYQPIPNSIHWVRLSNEFQFNWRDTLDTYDNGFAYIGDGSVIGLDGLPILGISLDIGDLASGASFEVDPYFSGVTKTWNAGAAGSAGDPANWDPVGHPLTGDNVTFDGTSVYNCNWNLTVTLGDFSMLAGFTGYVNQSTAFECVDWVVSAGIFKGGGIANPLTVWADGSFTTATMYDSSLSLIMNGTYATLTGGVKALIKLTINGATNFTSNGCQIWGLNVGSSGILTLVTSDLTQRYYSGPEYVFTNNGIIQGTKTYIFAVYNAEKTVAFGDIRCPVTVQRISGGTTSRTMTLLDDAVLQSNFYVYSADATYTFTLNCGGYDLTVAGTLTLGARGIITQGTGTITVGNYVQSGASSVFTQGGNIIVTGTSTFTLGTFTPSVSFTYSAGDDVTRTGCTITGSLLNLIITGSCDISLSAAVLKSLTLPATGTINWLSSGMTYTLNNQGCELILSASFFLVWDGIRNSAIGNGTFSGASVLYYYLTVGDAPTNMNMADWTIECPLWLRRYGGVCLGAKFSADIEVFGSFNLDSATEAISVDLNGHSLKCGNLSIGANCELFAGNSTITIEYSWSTASGVFSHDSNTVIFEETGTLAMASTDSFYNVTIGAGATVTMNTDTYVDCRATILGTMAGTGDFIEPLPAFTSTPDTTLYVGSVWEYTWSQEYWDTFAVESIPGWMIYESDTHTFKAMPNATGFYTFSVSLTWNDMVTYQNVTLLVEPSEPFIDADFIICFIILMVLMIMSILGLAVDRLRVLGLFVLFGVAIMAIPIILAFGTYYWVALIFLIACATMSAMNARSNARGK